MNLQTYQEDSSIELQRVRSSLYFNNQQLYFKDSPVAFYHDAHPYTGIIIAGLTTWPRDSELYCRSYVAVKYTPTSHSIVQVDSTGKPGFIIHVGEERILDMMPITFLFTPHMGDQLGFCWLYRTATGLYIETMETFPGGGQPYTAIIFESAGQLDYFSAKLRADYNKRKLFVEVRSNGSREVDIIDITDIFDELVIDWERTTLARKHYCKIRRLA